MAEEEGGEASPPRPVRSALGASDHAFDEPVHRVELLEGQPLPLGDTELALLVVERTGELVERALDEGRFFFAIAAFVFALTFLPYGARPTKPSFRLP